MFNHASLKKLARTIKRPVDQLLALSPNTDPFYADLPHRREGAEWFAKLYAEHRQLGDASLHLRRMHYWLVSQKVPVLLPGGKEYQNTDAHWVYLCSASLTARYLDLIPHDGLTDRRNDEAMIFAVNADLDPNADREVSCQVYNPGMFRAAEPSMPHVPFLGINGLSDIDARQDFVPELWIEKSTQNDWLVPLCRRRGVNLVVGIGEQSEIRARQLAERAAKYAVPAIVIYISDFDPGGRSMPKAVARKVEYTIQKFGLDVDLKLIPLALTPEQCRQYNLPRTPIKDGEHRKEKFELTFGVGATELDALEALHPGELGRLLKAELDKFLDPQLEREVRDAGWEVARAIKKIEEPVLEKFAGALTALETSLDGIVYDLDEWKEGAEGLWKKIAGALENERKKIDLSKVKIPRSKAPGKTDRFVLFDSTRDYLTQMDFYNAWREGDE